MIATIQYNSRKLNIDLHQPLDISIPIVGTATNVNAWYIGPPEIAPVVMDSSVISVAEGASVNFNQISFNPHAHGTHTETVGHITKKVHSIHKYLKQFFFLAEVITVVPEKLDEDYIISKKQLQFALGNKKREALVIRTLPNTRRDKTSKQYSNTNWPYFTEEAAIYLREKGIMHWLVDVPSVDKEKDNAGVKIRKMEMLIRKMIIQDGNKE